MKKGEILLVGALAILLIAAASANTAPILGEIDEEIIICESSALSFTFSATDVDANELTVGIFPSGPFFIRKLSSDPPLTQIEIFSENLTEEQADKTYNETIFISDGELTDTKRINIKVLKANSAPEIHNIGVQTILSNESHTFNKKISVLDKESGNEDSGNLTFTINDLSNKLEITIDNKGRINLTNSEIGMHEIKVCVTDSGVQNINEQIGFCGQGDFKKTSCKRFDLLITENNTAPTILLRNSTNLIDNIVGTEPVSFEVYKFDPDGLIPDTYWYVDNSLKQLDSGSSSDKFTYTFGCGVKESHTIKAVITDGKLNDSVTWQLNVMKINCADNILPGGQVGKQDCEEKWGCYDFGLCQNAEHSSEIGVLSDGDYQKIKQGCSENNWDEQFCGFQTRTCIDTNKCGTIASKPAEIVECYFSLGPSCSDEIKNCHDDACEFIVDCGGPCEPCPTCSDNIKNQDEEKIDCGPPCPGQCKVKLISAKEITLKQTVLLLILIFIILAVFQITRIAKTKKIIAAPSKREKRLARKAALLFGVFILLLFQVSAASDCSPQYHCSPWTECIDGLQSRTCEDTVCGRRDIVERSFCEKPGCKPKIECSPWTECIYTEKTDSLIEGKISFGGYRNRVCYDANDCVESFIQEGTCEESYNLELVEIQECDTNFLAVIDPVSERKIAKINLDSWKLNQFDLTFVQGNVKYCPSCYNTIQDDSEEGIDCGGDCKPCEKERLFLLAFALFFLWTLSGLFSFLSAMEIITIRKQKQTLEEMK
ncbi:MAG: hypothetical protein KJ858_05510 [Nanoarchaeota archaeon]|nr:hypothetical protein [Nanoarchaeota archaeon]